MDPKRWKQVDEILQAALDQPLAERDAFVRTACAGDDALEHEVESLMMFEESSEHFLSRPAIEGAAAWASMLFAFCGNPNVARASETQDKRPTRKCKVILRPRS